MKHQLIAFVMSQDATKDIFGLLDLVSDSVANHQYGVAVCPHIVESIQLSIVCHTKGSGLLHTCG